MKPLTRTSIVLALVLIAAMLPVSLRATINPKQMYHADIADEAGAGKGSAVIISRPGSYDYMARTFALPGSVVSQVWLAPGDNSWHIPLCTNGGPAEDDCTYSSDATGNLDIEGAVTPSMLMAAGVTGRQFNDAIHAGSLAIVLSDGVSILGSGFFIRIL